MGDLVRLAMKYKKGERLLRQSAESGFAGRFSPPPAKISFHTALPRILLVAIFTPEANSTDLQMDSHVVRIGYGLC